MSEPRRGRATTTLAGVLGEHELLELIRSDARAALAEWKMDMQRLMEAERLIRRREKFLKPRKLEDW